MAAPQAIIFGNTILKADCAGHLRPDGSVLRQRCAQGQKVHSTTVGSQEEDV